MIPRPALLADRSSRTQQNDNLRDWPAAKQWAMPALSHRRDPDARQENWHVYYGYLHVGTISMRP